MPEFLHNLVNQLLDQERAALSHTDTVAIVGQDLMN
jgi:hypothetical protein